MHASSKILPALAVTLMQIASASHVDDGGKHLAQQPILDTLLQTQQPQFDSAKDHGSSSSSDSSCVVSRLTAYEQTQGPVSFSLSESEHPEVPKLSALNSTVWEQWEFDGVSSSGTGSILMGFSRDPSYHFFGQGNLRVEFYMLLDDGTIIQELDYTQESTIITCDDSVTGIWNSSDRVYGFRVPRDMSSAHVWWDTGRERGSLNLSSLTPPYLANGQLWPPSTTNTKTSSSGGGKKQDTTDAAAAATATAGSAVRMAPGLYFNQPIAGGKMAAEVRIGKRKHMRIEGHGGHGRLWAEDGWFNICDGWHIVRGFVGPYTISYWEPVSRIDASVSYFSAQLFKDGELLVGAQIGNPANASSRRTPGGDDGDYVRFTPEFGGDGVSGRLADKSTGRVIEFVSPKRGGKTWRFRHDHVKKMFEMNLGGGKGLTGFVDRVVGGEADTDESHEGTGFSEQVVLPPEIKQWQIWVVYGIGFLGKWKSTVTNFVSSMLV
ncbi:hypothetical protein QBC42DRAFT_324128 [Cladorrhinum samala]|uniref:Uncharacterized protein n=1 Tax=Cladorrhinum samala TaxID=585594 RepID=A0AAV9HWT9_9PEZI|nr:hypothetical protein QBC42DRAFT_324128 [Cladorrhinum samala]